MFFKAAEFGLLEFITATLTVSDASSNNMAEANETLTYTVTLSNVLDDVAQADNGSNELHIPLPPNTTFSSVVSFSSGTLTHNSGVMQWNGSIAAGQVVTLVYEVTADNDVCSNATLSSQGTVFMDANQNGTNDIEEPTDDPATDNGADSDDDSLTDDDDPTVITVDQTSCDVDLEVKKTANPVFIDENGSVTYTIEITNNGPGDATNVTLEDPIPDSMTIQSTNPSTGSITINP